jgi:hypothetical protein
VALFSGAFPDPFGDNSSKKNEHLSSLLSFEKLHIVQASGRIEEKFVD